MPVLYVSLHPASHHHLLSLFLQGLSATRLKSQYYTHNVCRADLQDTKLKWRKCKECASTSRFDLPEEVQKLVLKAEG